MTRFYPKRPDSPEGKAANSILSGDVASAFQALRDRPQSEREKFIVDLAKSIISEEIETGDGKDGIKKAILLPNSIIGILQAIAGDERKRLAELFLAYCETRNWPGTKLKILRLPGMEPDPGALRETKEEILKKIFHPVRKATAAVMA